MYFSTAARDGTFDSKSLPTLDGRVGPTAAIEIFLTDNKTRDQY